MTFIIHHYSSDALFPIGLILVAQFEPMEYKYRVWREEKVYLRFKSLSSTFYMFIALLWLYLQGLDVAPPHQLFSASLALEQ